MKSIKNWVYFRILSERAKEKEELMLAKNELELRRDQIMRDLKNKENEIEALKRLHEIELTNMKTLTETIVKEKSLLIEDLQKVLIKCIKILIENYCKRRKYYRF